MDSQILQVSIAFCAMKYGSITLQKYFNWLNTPVEMSKFSHIVAWYKNLPPDDIPNDEAFRYACNNGHLDIALWLYNSSKDIDVHTT